MGIESPTLQAPGPLPFSLCMYSTYGGGNQQSTVILSAYSLVHKLAASAVSRSTRVRKFKKKIAALRARSEQKK